MGIVLKDILAILPGPERDEVRETSIVDNGALRLISIVHHAVLSAFRISVDIHIIVGGKPPAQLLLISRAPENCAVQKPAVLKAVGKSADIDSPALAEAVYRKLHLLFPFHKDRGLTGTKPGQYSADHFFAKSTVVSENRVW